MNQLDNLPNIGSIIAEKSTKIGITTKQELIEMGSENAIINISTL